jgi:hypothetical protein
MKPIRPKQFRLHLWLDRQRMTEMHGIQAKVNGKWTHCSENGKPLLFDSKDEANEKMMELSNGNPEGLLKLPKVV